MTDQIFRSEAGRQQILDAYQEALGLWPVPYDTRRITTRHGTTFAVTCGDPEAPPLVLLHGSASNAMMWLGDVRAYAERFHVIAVDMPGEPGPSEPVRFDLTGSAPIEWLEDVLSALGVGSVTLLGISLGGWLALKFATVAPARVERLVVLCPGGLAPVRAQFMLKAIPLSLLGRWGAERVMTMLNAGQPLAPPVLRYAQVIQRHFNPRREPLPAFTDAELQRLTMPVVVIAGAQDAMLDTQATVRRLAQCSPAVRWEVLPEAGHLLADQSGRVLRLLELAIRTPHPSGRVTSGLR